MNQIDVTLSLNELSDFMKTVATILDNDTYIILLKGDLASGKTTFVKEFAKYLHIKEEVTSPTFSIQNIYDNKIFHYDIYQSKIDGFLSSGLLEELDKNGYHIIEWADDKLEKILKDFHMNYLKIEILKKDDKRVYKVTKCTH